MITDQQRHILINKAMHASGRGLNLRERRN